MKLNDLKDNIGARPTRKRVGRGLGSGLGKTCGKGQKGQSSRTGVSLNGFEGGQNPLYRRLPKRGFKNIFRKEFSELTLVKLQNAISTGILDTKLVITEEVLLKAGIVRFSTEGVKLLGNTGLDRAINIQVSKASKAAEAHIKSLNGTLTVIS